MFSKPERENTNVKRRITPDLIQPLPTTILSSTAESTLSPVVVLKQEPEKSKECVICYESISNTKNMCITECGHEFCFTCMMKHARRNNGCPLCRTTMIEDESDSGSVSDSEYSEGEYDEDDDETIEEVVDESYPEFEIEKFVEAFEAKGYGLKEALSLLLNKFSKTDEKYTKPYIRQLENDIEDISEELQNECEEREEMASEDSRL